MKNSRRLAAGSISAWLVLAPAAPALADPPNPLGDAGIMPVTRTAGNPTLTDDTDDLDRLFTLQQWIAEAVDVDKIAAYRYDSSDQSWTKVPFQVDERQIARVCPYYGSDPNPCVGSAYGDLDTCELSYVWPGETDGDGDGVLDANDEIAFMAFELGDAVALDNMPSGVDGPKRYRIRVTANGQTGYLYLYRVSSGNAYNPADHYLDVSAGIETFPFEDCKGVAACELDRNHPILDEWTRWESDANHPSLADRDTLDVALQANWSIRELKVRAAGTATPGADLLDTVKWRGAGENAHHWNGSSNKMGLLEGPVRSVRGSVGAASGIGTTRYTKVYPTHLEVDTRLRVHPINGVQTFYDFDSTAVPASSTVYREDPADPDQALLHDNVDGLGFPGPGSLPPSIVGSDVDDYFQVNLPGSQIAMAALQVPGHEMMCQPQTPNPPPPTPAADSLVYRDDDQVDETNPGGGVVGVPPRPREAEAGAYGNIGTRADCAATGAATVTSYDVACTDRNYTGARRHLAVSTTSQDADLAELIDGLIKRDSDPILVTATYQVPGGGGPPCLNTFNADKSLCGFSQGCHNSSTISFDTCLNNSPSLDFSGTMVFGSPASGYPLGYLHVFSSAASGTGFLTILNGADGNDRVDGARIKVNGKVVFDPAEVGASEDWEERPIELQQGSNTLEIENLTTTLGALSLFIADSPVTQ